MTENAAPATQQSASKPDADEPKLAKIIITADRERFVPLEYPIEFKGELIEKIRVRRINGRELQAYIEKLSGPGRPGVPPTIDCPQEVWDVMDADDMDAVGDSAMDFMPRRLKAAAEQPRISGGSTSAS